jgi:hypothetical protein
VRVIAGNSSGSGFIYDEDGWVLTNAHVVGSRRDVKVIMGESVEFDGRVVGIDEGVDLAVIKVESDEPLPVLLFGDSSEVSVGDDVVALGFPLGSILGDAISVTKGVLSSRRNNDNILYLQTDAAINPGNSGGPLVNSSGEVIGLNTSRIERVLERSVQGIGLAIASNDINELLPALMDGAQVRNTSEQATEGGSDSDSRVYESDKYWYTIDVPPEWRMDSGNPENVSIWEPQTVSSIVIVAQEADVEEYPTIESYARGGWEPAPSEGWSSWRIVNSGPIRTDSTIQAYEFIYTFRLNGDRWTGKSQWYLLGGHRVRVDALAEQFVWNGTSGLIEQLLEVQESFEPAQYTSEEHGYSISHPLDWQKRQNESTDYWAVDPLSSAVVYVDIDDNPERRDIQQYGAAHSVQDSDVIARRLVFDDRPNPSYRIDFSVQPPNGVQRQRGAALITLRGDEAIWVFFQSDEDEWDELASVREEVLLRVAVSTP